MKYQICKKNRKIKKRQIIWHFSQKQPNMGSARVNEILEVTFQSRCLVTDLKLIFYNQKNEKREDNSTLMQDPPLSITKIPEVFRVIPLMILYSKVFLTTRNA